MTLSAVEQAEIDKLKAEEAFYRSRTRGFDLAAEDFERDIAERQASAEEHRIYSFYAGVDATSAFVCKATLGQWARQAKALGDDRPFTIEICSPGGSVIHGFALIDYIKELQAQGLTINTVGIGWVASMGGILLQAGDTRKIGKNSYLLIHEISDSHVGKMAELEDHLAFSRRLSARCVDILAERSTLTREEIEERWSRRDWWLDSDEALEYGFADELLTAQI